MGKRLRNKIMAGVLAGMMLVGVTPTKVFAAEDVVSKERLEVIVNEEVSKIDFENLKIDEVIEEINKNITNTVTGTVQGILTPDNIKIIITPIIKGLVNEALKDVKLPPQIDINKIIDDVIASEVVDKILTNELTQEIIERTIEYAVADIMNIIKVPTAGEIIETSKEDLTLSVIEGIWNADEATKKVLYYDYKVGLQGWRPVSTLVGWKRSGISNKIKLDLLKVVSDNTQAPDLSSIDYETIVKNAAKRAAKDVINEKIEAVKVAINTAIQNKIDELKQQAEQAIKDTINSIIGKFPSWPRR